MRDRRAAGNFFLPAGPRQIRPRGDDWQLLDHHACMKAIVLGPEDTQHGAVQTRYDAKKCAALFAASRDKIDGIVVTLPNFGEERAIADALPHVRPQRAGAGSRPRRTSACQHDRSCGPARQLLRENVRRQQPESSTTASRIRFYHSAHRGSRFGAIPQGRAVVRLRACRIVKGLKNRARRLRSARCPAAFQYRPLQRVRFSRPTGRRWKRGGPLRRSGAYNQPYERQRCGRAGETGRDPEIRSDGSGISRPRLCSRWPSWARSLINGRRKPTSRSPRCSAGPQSKITSAWCRARS